ncbi:MAG: hypothetical protein DWQ34_15465 [Planctomycetota bacterium]|nr:MAG: hypothetical protein DWQ34_15465 [Planctomycetota bacterium]REK20378.1 MAG: hypothetical protein DWQ41_25680 [Planctomycetota bacterium]REK26875.1 MAG: hypothetical protein DWQ45_26980 [Planctomycetota bacterium]
MKQEILSVLAAVHRRQQRSFAVRAAVWGLLASALLGVVVGIWKVLTGQPIGPGVAGSLLLAGPVIGLVAGLLLKRPMHAAAIAVDEHYRLKDRSITALQFVAEAEQTPLRELQVSDTAAHLRQVDARSVAPLRMPKTLPYAVVTLLTAMTLLFWPVDSQEILAKPLEPLPGILMAADEIDRGLEELKEIAEEEEDEELKELIAELEEEVDAMKLPGVELKEALEKISEMQERMQQEQAEYNESLMDNQLQSVGGALMAAGDFQGAGAKLEQKEFDEAAEELEQLEQVNLQRKEQRALEEKLGSLAETCEQLGLGQLADTLSEMCEGCKSGNSGKMSESSRKLARQTRRHQRRKTINSLLRAQCNRLSECKGMCKSNQVGPPRLVNEQSNKPSEQWGKATTGSPYGDKSDIASAGDVEEITGQAGDGPSEVEITYAPEGREQARRQAQGSYDEYQKMAEAVLDSEPIPLGHRQTIRTYFELIRPGIDEAEAVDEATAK